MRAVRIHQFGGPDVLRLEDVAKPTPGQGELLIRVLAAGVNPVDYKTREGRFPPVQADKLPLSSGPRRGRRGRGAGRGSRRLRHRRGGVRHAADRPRRLCRMGGGVGGALRQQSGSPRSRPRRLGPPGGAHGLAGPLHPRSPEGRTAGADPWRRRRRGAVRRAVRKWAGAEVFTTVSARDRAFVEDLGADRGIDYATERFETLVQNADLVFDLIGGETQDRSWSVLKRGGALVSTVEAPDVAKARERGVIARRFMCEPDGGQLASIARLIDESKVRVTVERVFPLAEAALAETPPGARPRHRQGGAAGGGGLTGGSPRIAKARLSPSRRGPSSGDRLQRRRLQTRPSRRLRRNR